MNELSSHNTGAGKGDHDRSPKWRDHYDEIDWSQFHHVSGFERIGPGRLRKRYGARTSAGVSVENLDNITYESKTPSEHIARRNSQLLAGFLDPAAPGTDSTVSALPKEGEACCGQCGCQGDN
jgi:hypothetical protein